MPSPEELEMEEWDPENDEIEPDPDHSYNASDPEVNLCDECGSPMRAHE